MKKELKKLLHSLVGLDKQQPALFETNVRAAVLYLFFLRYDAIRKKLKLPDFGYRQPYSLDYPYGFDAKTMLIEPFINQFVDDSEANLSAIKQQFEQDNIEKGLVYQNIREFDDLINKCGVKDFSIDSFSIDEFDEFFIALIGGENSRKLANRGVFSLNPSFAHFIAQNCLYDSNWNEAAILFGDATGEIPLYLSSEQEIKALIDDSNSLWYQLRAILNGHSKFKIDFFHLYNSAKSKKDFVFIQPPYGKLNKSNRIQLVEDIEGIKEFPFSSLESLYTSALTTNTNRAFALMPEGFLYSNSKDAQKIRKQWVNNESLKTIIRLPYGVLNSYSGIKQVLVELDFTKKHKEVLYIDGIAISNESRVKRSNREPLHNVLKKISDIWQNKELPLMPYSKLVGTSEIAYKEYSLMHSNFMNVAANYKQYQRSKDEEIVSLMDILTPIRTGKVEEVSEGYVINNSDLSDSIADFPLTFSDLKFENKPFKGFKISQSAILIGRIGGYAKPTYFEYEGNPVYIKMSMYAFELKEAFDPEYMIHELHSDFVKSQFRKLETGTVISNLTRTALKNVFVRIPSNERQREIIKENTTTLAKEKIKEVGHISKQLRVVEKDYLSGFKHDFMQKLGYISSGINILNNYLHKLAEEGVISLEDQVSPLYPGEKPTIDNSVNSTILRLQNNVEYAIDFLEAEFQRMTEGLDEEAFEKVELVNFFKKKWLSDVNQDNFKIQIQTQQLDEKGKPDEIVVEISEVLFRSLLNNIVENAKQHGFSEAETGNIIQFTLGVTDIDDKPYAVMHVANNGKPFPDNMSLDKFLQSRVATGKNKGSGFGGSRIKKIVEEHKGFIRESNAGFSKEIWPFQFELLIPIVE